ncbi:DUF1345 domain-containing protein [Phenylobacterium sp. LjRoot225]|uniref:DUF1345 domain-containing protein n=1 Tax=Phenylobacterium sp. LjRoot225 TaxID=3342285 RepID=UPI003ECDDE38
MAQMGLPSWFGPFAARPRLVASFVGGGLAALAVHYVAGVGPVTASIVGWDTLCLGFIISTLWGMASRSPDAIRARAAQDDEGRAVILAVVLTAAVAAVVAVALELSLAKEVQGLERALRVGLAFGTVAASWFLVQLIFALHYAHGYYGRSADGTADAEGLRFPGEEPPDYWDFVHFAVIIGVASQTADIAISAKPLRRLNTVHALFSFAFNTVILALTINLLAGLFG